MKKTTEEFRLPERNPLRLMSYLMKYKRLFWTQAAGGITYNTVIVAGPILLGRALDAAGALEKSGVSPERIRMLALFSILLVLATVFFQYARYIKRWYLRNMTNRIACDMRAGLLSSVLRYPMTKIEEESVGDLMSRTVGDVEEITSTMYTTINEIWDTFLLMISYFIVLMYYDYRITLIASLGAPLALLVSGWVRGPLYRVSMNARISTAVVSSHLQKTLSGLTILRLFGREVTETERLKDYSRNQMKWNIRTSLFQTGMMPVYATVSSVGIIVVIGMGAGKVVGGDWTVGTFAAYLSMFTLMVTRTRVAAQVFNRFHAASASWTRIKTKLQESAEMQGEELSLSEVGPRQGRPDVSMGSPLIRVENLSFSYPKSNHEVLNNVNFVVNRGDFVGVTGPVGSGKSTLAVLLTGLYPYSGKIIVHGRDLSCCSGAEKAGVLAYSGQDAFLFSASIAQNITFQEKSTLSKEMLSRLDEAIYVSALAEDMALFPQGLETQIGEEGIRISGGQRQRIALARAIFTGNPVFILDDPFSAVDIGTEQRIIERMNENLQGRTIILFSHRLAAFTTADKVLVLDRGRLVEQGDHTELMALDGIYQKIYSAQSFLLQEAHTNA
ncbi:MAG: ABC transporter ATP-binding protein [Chloroflexi bacterium]|nr:ABC transporter ATP-binding protein [Chloroflexota bacterium]